jgi:NAD-dependent SIR2 family protein deacetylase
MAEMRKYYCDRCGKEVDTEKENIHHYEDQPSGSYDSRLDEFRDFDVCEKCKSELAIFIKGEKEKETVSLKDHVKNNIFLIVGSILFGLYGLLKGLRWL